jgi:hypothetical protein
MREERQQLSSFEGACMADHGKKFTPKPGSKKDGRTAGGPDAKFHTYDEKGSGGESCGSVHPVRRPAKHP